MNIQAMVAPEIRQDSATPRKSRTSGQDVKASY